MATRAKKATTTKASHSRSLADDASLEASLWPALQPVATGAVRFWNTFLRLRSGTEPLSDKQLRRWVDLTRAVCWVESKHGTYDGGGSQHGKVDPTQCADVRNPWWPELTGGTSTPDRFVRSPGLNNLGADELPAAAAGDSNFLPGAAIGLLKNPAHGSGDANFTQTHSIYWGVPLLIFKTNHAYAGDPCYQCSDLSYNRLTQGAGKYNGSAQAASYIQKIKAALGLFGGLPDTGRTLAFESAPIQEGLSGSNPAGHAPKPPVLTTRSSPNHTSRQGNIIQYLVLHNTDCALGPALNTLTQPGSAHPVSAHYVVDRSQDIYQLVSDSDVAWHAGNKLINQQSIGIELVAWSEAKGMTADQEASLVALARFVIDAYDIPLKNVLPHRRVRIGSTDCPGWIWPTDEEFNNWVNLHLA